MSQKADEEQGLLSSSSSSNTNTNNNHNNGPAASHSAAAVYEYDSTVNNNNNNDSNSNSTNVSQKRYKLQFQAQSQSQRQSQRQNQNGKQTDHSTRGVVVWLNAGEFALKTMHEHIPSVCIMGMEGLEYRVEDAAVERAADLVYAGEHKGALLPLSSLKGEAKLARLYEKQHIMDVVATRVNSEVDDQKHTAPLQRAIFVAFCAYLLMGYNIGVLTAQPFHTNNLAWLLIATAFAAGGMLGSLLAGYLADSKGRRVVLIVNAVLYTVGGILQTQILFRTISVKCHILSRLLIGVAAGASTVVLPSYLGEIAPPCRRGKIGNLLHYATATGLLLSFAIAFGLELTNWFILGSVTVIFGLVQLVLSISTTGLVESPRWMLSKDPHSAQARIVLAKLRDLTDTDDNNTHSSIVEHEALHLTSANTTQSRGDGQCRIQSSWAQVMPNHSDPEQRKFVVASIVLKMAEQLTGINAILYYSTLLFKGVDVENPYLATLFLGMVNLVAVFSGGLLQKWVGLRRLLLWSTGGMTICWILLVLALSGHLATNNNHHSNTATVVSLLILVFCYQIGFGTASSLVFAELVHVEYVTPVLAKCTQIGWIFHFLVVVIFPFMKDMSPYSYIFFVMCLGTTDIYIRMAIPATPRRRRTARKLYIDLTAQSPVESMHVNAVD